MASAVRRKVLLRDDFGLCVCWPKTHWAHVPEAGQVGTVVIDGVERAVTVHSEACNCQGTGWQEHRFLGLPAEAGLMPGDRPLFAPVGDAGRSRPDVETLTVGAVIREVNDARLAGRMLAAPRRRGLSRFLAQRQGQPGAYAGLFAPVEGELADGYRMLTGERIRTQAGARHILGEEALRALILLSEAMGSGGERALVGEAISRAAASMEKRLQQLEVKGSGVGGGFYCCHTCTAALWRALAVGAYVKSEARLAAGLELLTQRRDGKGGWRSFPFYYTVSALIEMPLELARKELLYVRGTLEASASAPRGGPADDYARRRRMVVEKALTMVG